MQLLTGRLQAVQSVFGQQLILFVGIAFILQRPMVVIHQLLGILQLRVLVEYLLQLRLDLADLVLFGLQLGLQMIRLLLQQTVAFGQLGVFALDLLQLS